MSEKDREQEKRPPAEKPISLAGAKFKEVLKALLETKPMPKEDQAAPNHGETGQE